MNRVLLVNMPFAAVESPSLALGLLKSGLVKEGIPCDVEYLNIRFAEMIGMENYNFVVMGPGYFFGERVFAHVLFADRIPDDVQYCTHISERSTPDAQYRLHQIKAQTIPYLQYCLQSVPWDQYDIIGFSSLFEQNLSALTLAYLVKQRYPHKIIVFGGPNWEGIMGLTLHKCFSFVDFVCSGEADHTFPELVKRLYYGHPVNDLAGIVYRENGRSVYSGRSTLIHDLDTLPFPDYDDYFRTRMNSSLGSWVPPYLLFETSRGCWWGEKSQCMFCGLNGEGAKFRSKSTQRIIDEILYLLQRYNIRVLRATDNVINLRYFKDLLPLLAKMKLGADLIFEIRANLKKHQVKKLAEAGVTIIQAGIENLCTHILKLMNKGTNSLMNIQLLKWCKQYRIKGDWNIIYGFPGEKPEDYRRCLELANVLSHLNPPTGFGPVRMDRFSPNFNRAEELGFINLRPMASYRYIYPFDTETLFDLAYYFDFDYRDKIDDGGFYNPLYEVVWRWKSSQDQLYANKEDGSLAIYDTRPVATAPKINLSGNPRSIYEYCDKTRSLEQIEKWLKESGKASLNTAQIKVILDNLTARNLMVREENRYLSLAIMTSPLETD